MSDPCFTSLEMDILNFIYDFEFHKAHPPSHGRMSMKNFRDWAFSMKERDKAAHGISPAGDVITFMGMTIRVDERLPDNMMYISSDTKCIPFWFSKEEKE